MPNPATHTRIHTDSNRFDRPIAPISGRVPSARETVCYVDIAGRTTRIERPLPRRLLGIWAHPDDECYLSAGLMARVVAAGGEVTIVTATRGEKGTSDPDAYDSDAFGAHREAELEKSLSIVGVDDLRFLGLRDGECDQADDDEMIDRLCATIDAVEPDAIVTFGPDGMTYHADHRKISAWATEACRRTGAAELLYATVTHDWQARHRGLHERIGIHADMPDGRPVTVGLSSIALECDLDDTELARKRAALAAHGSQTTGLAELMGEDTYREWFRTEYFRRPSRAELYRSADVASLDRLRDVTGVGS